ncbi:MAG: sugar ABC transporter permease, partial [SAR324 cluster bacterium]|nr:sugar ABC transporter permease [SAR324 cluster bacterium]
QISFTSQRVVGSEFEFIGPKNYFELFGDKQFISSLGKSAIWVLANGFFQTLAALLIALLLNQPFRGQNFVRTWIILPWAVPAAVTAILWRWMFDASAGIVNTTIKGMDLVQKPVLFLANPDIAGASLTFVNSWRYIPFLTIIFLASLASVPEEEYEAAQVDGANAWLQFKTITFPNLLPTLTVLGLVGTLWASNVFDIIWMMTRGGPGDATTTVPVLMYDMAFYGYNISKATAGAIIFLCLLIIFAFVFIFANRKQFVVASETFQDLSK